MTSILENTAESLPAYFLTLTKILIFVKNYRSDERLLRNLKQSGETVLKVKLPLVRIENPL